MNTQTLRQKLNALAGDPVDSLLVSPVSKPMVIYQKMFSIGLERHEVYHTSVGKATFVLSHCNFSFFHTTIDGVFWEDLIVCEDSGFVWANSVSELRDILNTLPFHEMLNRIGLEILCKANSTSVGTSTFFALSKNTQNFLESLPACET